MDNEKYVHLTNSKINFMKQVRLCLLFCVSTFCMMQIAFATRVDSVDVLHYELNLTIRNLGTKTISGKALITARCNYTIANRITLDLLQLGVSEVRINDSIVSFIQTDSTLHIQCNQTYSTNDTLQLEIAYSGQPKSDGTWGGFYFSGDYAYNMGVGFDANPHNFGRCWFPCNDNFTDRATYEFHVETDSGFVAVCNGLKLSDTAAPDGGRIWNWRLQQPIPTYLASVAVGRYALLEYSFTGKERTYPVVIAVTSADTVKAKTSLQKLNQAIACFEEKYGPYAFDRVGYVGVPFNAGAMEHATNIAYPLYALNGNFTYETLFAHELAHMWWGNLATCSTAADMWLNEGWASFNEALFLECVYGTESYYQEINQNTLDVLLGAPRNDGAWYPVSGVPHNATYGNHVYKKGALMAHTLRSIMGDSSFFSACKTYFNTFYMKAVNTADLQAVFQQHTNIDLGTFFANWILLPGHSATVVSNYKTIEGPNGIQHQFELTERYRYHNSPTAKFPVTLSLHLSNQNTPVLKTIWIESGQAQFDTILSNSVALIAYELNSDQKVHLGQYTTDTLLSNTGLVNLPNVLFSLNIQRNSVNPNRLFVTHYWVGAIDQNLRNEGIRISPDRYWSVQGIQDTTLNSWAFLNYNGTPSQFLDADLMADMQTEDSLVLLYREGPGKPWKVHTNNTFQPGGSKTDKSGRFWITRIQNGEYAFGLRDVKVVGIAKNQKQTFDTFGFLVIPNPASSTSALTVQFEQPLWVKDVEIHDAKAKRVCTLSVKTTTQNLSLKHLPQLPAGQYYLTVTSSSTSKTQSFLIE